MKYDFPYLRRQNKEVGIRIEVMADSLRVGKTTAVAVIANGLRARGKKVTVSDEDWQHNPYLAKSYSDPAKNFLDSQKWFIKRKWEQIRDGAGTDIFIQDVSPEMDYCYAATSLRLGRMSPKHFAEYDKYYRSLDWEVAPSPDLVVYLQVSDEGILKRAEASLREFETVESDYFLMMKKVNREWLAGAKKEISNHKFSNSQMKILEIDTDKLDFANDESAKKRLVELVANNLGL